MRGGIMLVDWFLYVKMVVLFIGCLCVYVIRRMEEVEDGQSLQGTLDVTG